MWHQLFVSLLPLLFIFVFFLLPGLLATIALLRRTDLTNFQLWSLFILSWIVPVIGALATWISLSHVVPKNPE